MRNTKKNTEIKIEKLITKGKKIIFKTPFNRNYIADTSLRKRIGETVSYVKGKVLDVGCGEKPYKKIFCSVSDGYIGLDHPSSHHFYTSGTHADVYGDASSLPFVRQSFDTVLCTEVLPHIENPSLCFSELASVMKPGGVLIVTANKSWEQRTGLPTPDFWRFTDQGLALLAKQQNLSVIYTKSGCGFFAMIGQMLCRFLNKELIYRKTDSKGIDRKPSLIAAFFVLPIIAFIHLIFIMLEKIYKSELDTLFYILVAQKPNKDLSQKVQ